MGTIGRLYVYIVALVSLLVAAYGAGSLLSTIGKVFLQSGMEITPGISFWRTTISTYTPMLLVGGAIWAIHWLGIRGRVAQSIDEQQAVLSKLFINGILTIASIFALLNAVRLIYHVISTVTNASMPPLDIRGRPWDVYNALVWLVVYAMIWYYYWQVDEEEGRSTASGVTLRRWYVYITSLVSLGVLGIGLYFSLSLIISYLVRGTAVQIVGGGLGSLLRNWSLTLAPILGGFLWWWLHWLRVARGDIESVLRQVYLYL
ncbi:MAG: hypothetical protein HW403_1244 [Dehalococcoidia bacterium]|nr:hypothetical protein [Dehalococcoidia bacterium]